MTDTLTGIIPDLDEVAYHTRPELSSTGARLILDSPARFHHRQTHPEPYKKQFDVGSAVHAKVLGIGAPISVIPADVLASNGAASTAAAKAFIADARAVGSIPVKQGEADEINGMVEAVLSHPVARTLFEQPGTAEASVFATDPATGVGMRARFDYLPDLNVADPWTVDLKTTALSASPDGFSKTVSDHRYDIQQEWYLQTYALATGDFMARMKFVVVEKNAPYLVGVYPLATEYAEMARMRVAQALHIYAACMAAGDGGKWPGYPTNPDPIQPPTWLMFSEGMIE
jgi:hypothetical protein